MSLIINSKKTAKIAILCLLTLLTGFVSSLSFSQAYPDRPITIVVGFGVGGSADRMARAMSTYISAEIGQPVHVVNRLGAGTLLAANYVLNQPNDGYTVFASSFAPYLYNTILEGNAEYKVSDFAYINLQWFDEDLIALYKNSSFVGLPDLLEAIKSNPKKVRGAVVKGSAGHLMAKLLLEVSGIPEDNLNLVTYNSGGMARAAVAGGVVDFIIISAEGTESIMDFIRPLAIVSDEPNAVWGVPTINTVLAAAGLEVPILQGSVRGFATTAEFKRNYPERFEILTSAIQRATQNPELIEMLNNMIIGTRWIGPVGSERIIFDSFDVFSKYSNLIN